MPDGKDMTKPEKENVNFAPSRSNDLLTGAYHSSYRAHPKFAKIGDDMTEAVKEDAKFAHNTMML